MNRAGTGRAVTRQRVKAVLLAAAILFVVQAIGPVAVDVLRSKLGIVD